jgi:hypothetical protein
MTKYILTFIELTLISLSISCNKCEIESEDIEATENLIKGTIKGELPDGNKIDEMIYLTYSSPEWKQMHTNVDYSYTLYNFVVASSDAPLDINYCCVGIGIRRETTRIYFSTVNIELRKNLIENIIYNIRLNKLRQGYDVIGLKYDPMTNFLSGSLNSTMYCSKDEQDMFPFKVNLEFKVKIEDEE